MKMSNVNQRFRKIKIAAVLLAVAFALSFAACGSEGGRESSESYDSGGGAENAAQAEEPAASEAAKTAPALDDSASADADAAALEDEALASSAQSGVGLPGAGRKITFSASYTIETKKYDEDYGRINRLVQDAGGYIANEQTEAYPYESAGATGRNSYFSLKIPAEGYDSFLDKLSKVGEVANKTKSSEDLTAEYFDTESRINVLKMRRDRLTEYIRNATKPADIVQFEQELSQVLIDLDQYEGNKRRMDQLVDYATVDVTLREMITPETIGKDGQPLGGRASDAFRLSATGVGEFLQSAAVFLAGAAPVIALIAVILIVIWLIVRGIRRVRPKSTGKAKSETEEK
jgi:hypothetical protein